MSDAIAILLEKYGVRFDAEEGRWVTTEKDHKIHINGEGVPDKGNPYVMAAMRGENVKEFAERKAFQDRVENVRAVKKIKNKMERLKKKDKEDREKAMQRSDRIETLGTWIEVSQENADECRKKLARMAGQEDTEEYKKTQAKLEMYEERLSECEKERNELVKEGPTYDQKKFAEKYEKAAAERDAAVLKAYPNASACRTAEEVGDYMRAKGFFKVPHHEAARNDLKVDIELMTDENAKALGEHMDALVGDYPWIAGEIEGVRCGRTAEPGVYAYSNGSGVTFEADYFGHGYYESEVARRYESDVRKGFHPEGTDYKSTIDHEMTHQIERAINRNPAFENDERFAGYERAGDYVMAKVAERLGRGSDEKDRQEIRAMVSRYAADNGGIRTNANGEVETDSSYGANTEFLAEAISEARCSKNPRQIAVMVEEEFNNLMDELGLRRKKKRARKI